MAQEDRQAPGAADHQRESGAAHYALLQRLNPVLAANAPTATINNPEWFRADGTLLFPRAERRLLHKQIISSLLPQETAGTSQGKPVAILLAGPPGSGKSTSLADVFESGDDAVTGGLSRDDFVVIDADAIKGQLIEHARRDGSLESWIKPEEVRNLESTGEHFSPLDMASLVHEESSLIAKKVRDKAIDQRRNIVFDQVCSSPDKTTELVDQLNQAGYTVNVVEIHASREFSIESTFGRYVATADRGGEARRVPTEVVNSVFTETGESRPRMVIESLLTSQPAKIAQYRRYEARELAKPPVLVEKGARTQTGTMSRQPVKGSTALMPSPQRKTKDEVLAAHLERARSLAKSAGRVDPKGRRGPTL